MSKLLSKDRTYRLLKGSPLSYTLQSRNNPRNPLMWFDEKNNINRVLRYAINQKSPFEDEQDGNAVVNPIIFEDGLLFVPKNNPVLQEFLYYHPMNGRVFEEVDKERDANQQIENLNAEVDALIEAKNLSIDQMEMLVRVVFGKDPALLTTAEMKRDILVFAKKSPKDFIEYCNDPELKYEAKIRKFFSDGLLNLRNGNKEIWVKTMHSKKKMCSIPYGSDPYSTAGNYLKGDEGIEILKMLDAIIES